MKTWIAEIIDEELISQRYLTESNDEFVERICSLCLEEIELKQGYSPMGFGLSVIEEIELEIKEILKIRTYGFYNLSEYKNHHLKKSRVG